MFSYAADGDGGSGQSINLLRTGSSGIGSEGREGHGKGPREEGPSDSRPVSRILSMNSHPSERPTWTSAGNLQTVRLGLASSGVCLAAASPRRRCALTAPFQPCPYAGPRREPSASPRRRRCHFCGTVPRVSPGRRYRPPCPAMSGLSSKTLRLRGCSACRETVARRAAILVARRTCPIPSPH
jgi:hypothetical protein